MKLPSKMATVTKNRLLKKIKVAKISHFRLEGAYIAITFSFLCPNSLTFFLTQIHRSSSNLVILLMILEEICP